MPPRRNPHAIALGARGGSAGTEAQNAARRRNGLNGGRPRTYRLHCNCVERLDGETWILVEPLDEPAKAYLRRRRALRAARLAAAVEAEEPAS